MHRERDVDLDASLPPGAEDLVADLGLEIVCGAMAAGDDYLMSMARRTILSSLTDIDTIRYRQGILADCLAHPRVVRQLHAVATSAIERERRVWGVTARYPEALLHRCVEVLGIFLGHLRELRAIATVNRPSVASEGFRRLFAMLTDELDESYIECVADHLRRLRFRGGVLMSARLGRGNQGTQYQVRAPLETNMSLGERLRGWLDLWMGGEAASYEYEVHERDESGFRALQDLRNRELAPLASALVVSTAHILDFFKLLRAETAFYVGCLNLRERLGGEPVCLPDPVAADECFARARGLYDLSLRLSLAGTVVGNDLSAERERLVMITGANRGGKTTCLRGIGIAQLLMQCGAFAPAHEYRAGLAASLFTHFKRGEDRELRRGKLEEELARMSGIVDRLAPGSMLLLNESFASTNEREGSEIARQIVRALLERGVRVAYVTHLVDLAAGFYRAPPAPALFLRAERLADGRRTFKLLPGEPLSTSYGADLYARVCGVGSGSGTGAGTLDSAADAR